MFRKLTVGTVFVMAVACGQLPETRGRLALSGPEIEPQVGEIPPIPRGTEVKRLACAQPGEGHVKLLALAYDASGGLYIADDNVGRVAHGTQVIVWSDTRTSRYTSSYFVVRGPGNKMAWINGERLKSGASCQ